MNPHELSLIFAANVRRLIASHGWTQNEFGQKLGVKSGAASRMLSGAHTPTGVTIARVAELFGVAPHELLLPEKPANGKPKK